MSRSGKGTYNSAVANLQMLEKVKRLHCGIMAHYIAGSGDIRVVDFVCTSHC